MKKLWLLIPCLLYAAGAIGQNGAFNGLCSSGGRTANVSGLSSSNNLSGIIPGCRVDVYLTGTTTRATIFKDAGGTTLSNPFTAAALGSAAPGQWLFFAATGQGYDVVMSGGTAPNAFPMPVTLTDLQVGGGGGGATIAPTITFLKGTNIGNQGVQAAPSDLATFLGGLTNCGTTGFAYSPADGQCIATGGGSSPTGPQFKAGIYNVGSGPFSLGNANWGTGASGNDFIMPSGGVGVFMAGAANNVLLAQSTSNANYSSFTFNNDSRDDFRLGFTAGNAASGDPNLYIDAPVTGNLFFRPGAKAAGLISATQGFNTLGVGIYSNALNPVFNLGSSGAFTANALNDTENRNAAVLLGVGTTLPSTYAQKDNQQFVGAGRLWRASNQAMGPTTQVGHYINYNSLYSGQSLYESGQMFFPSDGDQISSETFQFCGGNGGQENAENCHSRWHFIRSYASGASSPCLGGCGGGSTAVIVNIGAGTGNIIYDKNSVISGTITGPIAPITGMPFAGATLSGFSFGASKIVQINEASDVNQNIVTVGTLPTSTSVSISTSPYYTGALISTSTLPSSGFGCMANPPQYTGLSNENDDLEMEEHVAYTVVDATHMSIKTYFQHSPNSIFAVGGACGLGLEMHAQTNSQGVPTVYPIIASTDSSHVYYEGGNLSNFRVGTVGQRNFENASCPVTNVQKTGTLATIAVTDGSCTGLAGPLNNKSVTIAGITVGSGLNGTFTVSSIGGGNYTYNTTSGTVVSTPQTATLTSGDTVGNMYQMAKVLMGSDPANPASTDFFTTDIAHWDTSSQIARGLPYYSQVNGDAIGLETAEDTLLGGYGLNITLAGGEGRRDSQTSSPQGGLIIQNSEPPQFLKSFGGNYDAPDQAISVVGHFQVGISFDSPTAGMFFNHNGLPPGATSYTFCPYTSIFGPSLCVNQIADGSTSTTAYAGDDHQFRDHGGSRLTFEVLPTFQSGGQNVGKNISHAPFYVTPDFGPTDNLPAFTVSAPGGAGSPIAGVFNGFVQMNGLQTGLTCVSNLGIDSSNNVFPTGACTSGGGGTVNSFSAGNLSPLFTTSVATATTTPALSFALSTQSANTFFAGPTTGSAATPTFRGLVAADLPLATTGAFGAVQPDGTTITISGGVISSTGGGSGLPCSGTCTANVLPKFGSGGTSVTNSLADDGVTTANTFTYAGTGGISASAGPLKSAAPSGGVGSSFFLGQEGTVPSGLSAAGQDNCYADSTAHGILCNFNGAGTKPVIIGSQYTKGSCTEVWGGSGTSFALTSGDDAISNNTCYNDSGVTRTITAVKCRSDVASNTTTVNPTFGSAGTGTTILSGALTCGSSLAYSSSGTVSNASWTTGSGISPAMGGTLTGTSIAMIVEYTY